VKTFFEGASHDPFASLHPLGYAGNDTNLYRYVGNNPIVDVDPTGLKKAPKGPTNINSLPSELGAGCDYYIVIATNSGSNFAGGLGHSWVGIIDNTTSPPTVTARGIGPENDPEPLGTREPSKIRDEAETEFSYACAYCISREQYEAAKKKMDKKPDYYQIRTSNCTVWALGILRGAVSLEVGKDSRAFNSGLDPCDLAGSSEPFYSPKSLEETLKTNPGKPAKCFGK